MGAASAGPSRDAHGVWAEAVACSPEAGLTCLHPPFSMFAGEGYPVGSERECAPVPCLRRGCAVAPRQPSVFRSGRCPQGVPAAVAV